MAPPPNPPEETGGTSQRQTASDAGREGACEKVAEAEEDVSAACKGVAAEPDPDVLSLTSASEWECPICYQLLCEPIHAGCNRHVFCRNCLLRSQRPGEALRCPICRASGTLDAVDIPELAPLVEKLRKRDPRYAERAAAARQERQELLQVRFARAQQLVWHGRNFEVTGAGSDDVNGIYMASTLPTYVGPVVYRKSNTCLFIYRWHQRQWVIAELRVPYGMGDEREWLYSAPMQNPPEVPPVHGWQASEQGRARNPAPEVRPIHSNEWASFAPYPHHRYSHLRIAAARRQPEQVVTTDDLSTLPGAVMAEDITSRPWPTSVLDEDAQARCRCTPSCGIM